MASWFEHQSRNALAALAGSLFPVAKRSPESVRRELEAGTIRKILFVRPQQGIGDMLMLTTAFRALKERFPALELHVLASLRNQKALTRNPRLSRVWVGTGLRTLRAMRAERFDLAIPVFSHTPSWTNFAIARLLAGRVVWSFDSSLFYGGNNWSRSFAHVELPVPDSALPEWRQYLRLVEPLVGPVPEARTEYVISSGDMAWANQQWGRLLPEVAGPVVGLFVGGNPDHPGRFVPADTWLALSERLNKEGAQIVLIHPPHEPFLYKQIQPRLPKPLPVIDEYDLGRVLAFLQRLSLFVCADGGTFHLAAAAGVQTVGLFVSTDPARWCPPGPHVQAISLSDINLIRLPQPV